MCAEKIVEEREEEEGGATLACAMDFPPLARIPEESEGNGLRVELTTGSAWAQGCQSWVSSGADATRWAWQGLCSLIASISLGFLFGSLEARSARTFVPSKPC